MEFTPITSMKKLSETVYSFRRSRIILTAFEFGLFSKLGENSLAAALLIGWKL